jgi:hypothetical protein
MSNLNSLYILVPVAFIPHIRNLILVILSGLAFLLDSLFLYSEYRHLRGNNSLCDAKTPKIIYSKV